MERLKRIKLATELSKMTKGNTIYILDEPTTGLHFEDIRKLLEVLNQLCRYGVIIMNMMLIKNGCLYYRYLDLMWREWRRQIVACGTPRRLLRLRKVIQLHI